MDLGGNTGGLFEWHGPCWGTSLGPGHGHRWWPSLQASARPSVVGGAMDINTDCQSCARATDPDMTQAQTSPWPPWQAGTPVSRFLGALDFRYMPFPPAHEPFCLPLSSVSPPYSPSPYRCLTAWCLWLKVDLCLPRARVLGQSISCPPCSEALWRQAAYSWSLGLVYLTACSPS